MRDRVAALGLAYRRVAALVATGLIAAIAIAAAAVPDRLASAYAALRGEPVLTREEAMRVEQAAAELRERAQRFEETRRRQEAELRRLELAVESALAGARAERAAAERARNELRETVEATRDPARGDAFRENVELFSRVDVSTARALLKPMDDEAVARYLRALRPTRAAELVDSMIADASWQERLPRILTPRQP